MVVRLVDVRKTPGGSDPPGGDDQRDAPSVEQFSETRANAQQPPMQGRLLRDKSYAEKEGGCSPLF